MKASRVLKWSSFPSFVLFIIIVIVNSFVSENFMSIGAWTSFLQTTIPIILISIGMSVVMLAGGIDLSLGAIVSVVNVIIARTSGGFTSTGLQYEASFLLVPLLLSFVVAILFGLFNGFLISVVRVNALLATFASSFIGSGIALTILPVPGGAVPDRMMDFYYTNILKILPSGILFVIFLYLIWIFFSKTKFKVQLYAIGNNAFKAFFSGIKVNRIVFFTYIFSAFSAWLAGVAVSANFGGGDPRVGNAMTLSAIASCVIGGISLMGGIGEPSGGIFGALFLNLILVTVLGLGVPPYLQELVSGGIVVVGIILSVFVSERAQKIEIIKE